MNTMNRNHRHRPRRGTRPEFRPTPAHNRSGTRQEFRLKTAHSRDATTAHSCGWKPAVDATLLTTSREAVTARNPTCGPGFVAILVAIVLSTFVPTTCAQELEPPQLLEGAIDAAKVDQQKIQKEKQAAKQQAEKRPRPQPNVNVIRPLQDAVAIEEIALPQIDMQVQVQEQFIIDGPIDIPVIQFRNRVMLNGPVQVGPGGQPPVQPTNGNLELFLDEDQQRRLNKAREFVEQKRYDLSVPLWQKVLDEAGDRLVEISAGTTFTKQAPPSEQIKQAERRIKDAELKHSKESPAAVTARKQLEALKKFAEWVNTETGKPTSRTTLRYRRYEPVAASIEREIGQLPKAGLREYRLYADPEARMLLSSANATNRTLRLAQIVDRYFLSSFGDDAAFELACGKLERGESAGALALFRRLLNDYPDSDIPDAHIRLRMSIATARLGDAIAAEESLTQLASAGTTPQRVLELVRADFASERPATTNSVASGWPMLYGSAAHDGTMPDWKTSKKLSGLTELWDETPELNFGSLLKLPKNLPRVHVNVNGKRIECFYINGVMVDPAKYEAKKNEVISRTSIIEKWRQQKKHPVGDVLLNNGRAFFKVNGRVICLDAKSGRVLWRGRENLWEPDDSTKRQLLSQLAPVGYGGSNRPSNFHRADIDLFSDHLQHSISIGHDIVLTLEGDLPGNQLQEQENANGRNMMMWGAVANGTIQRSRRNWLTAYDANDGTLAWSRTPSEAKQGSGAFLCAPVATDNFLIVPASIDGVCVLLALDPKTGATAWRRPLSNERSMADSKWTQGSVAIDGGDAFVCTGTGFLQSVDVATGSLNWANEYFHQPEPAAPANAPRGFNVWQGRMTDRGSQSTAAKSFQCSDAVFVKGSVVLVAASDNDRLFALHRATGELLWDTEIKSGNKTLQTQLSYVAGLHSNGIIIGGRSWLKKYDIHGGELKWTLPLKDSCGRAAVTESEILVPAGDSVLRVNPLTGETTGTVRVVNATSEPIGNVYSDGGNLLVLGAGRLYSLGNIDQRLAELSQDIQKADNVDTRFARAEILGRIDRLDDASSDIEAGYTAMLNTKMSLHDRHARLFEVLESTKFAACNPQETLAWFTKARQSEVDGGEVVPRKLPVRDRVLAMTMDNWPQDDKAKTGFNIKDVMFLAPYFSTAPLRDLAENLVQSVARVEDEQLLRDSLQAKDPITVGIARVGLEIVMAKADTPRLLNMLNSEDENEQLVGATALATLPHRATLPVLLDLLTSKSPEVRGKAIVLLRGMTGHSEGYNAADAVYKRRRPTLKWQKWIAGHGDKHPLKKVTRRERRKSQALDQLVSLSVRGLVLGDVTQMISRKYGVTIQIGADIVRTPIDKAQFKDVTLRSALKLLLTPRGLTYTFDGETNEVTIIKKPQRPVPGILFENF